tara:strand:- start:541 stop:756 length:216 start_codon:yes stop_codon:yes gene_type:complete
MDWISKGLIAAFWQVLAFLVLLILVAGGLWSCAYLGINPGYGILAFYVSVILFVNLYLSWSKSKKSTTSEE